MKKTFFAMVLTLALMLSLSQAVFAADAVITYKDHSFNATAGTDYTATDLFDDLKGCMPGDSLTETIILRNESAEGDKIRVTLTAEVTDPTYSESYEAEDGNDQAYKFPRPVTPGKYDFSFSGLKTAVINQAHHIRQAGGEINAADFAASFRKSVVDLLVEKAVAAAKDTGADKLAIAGGVAANSLLRREIVEKGEKAGLKVFVPPKWLCTDNAVMIGAAAFYDLMRRDIAELDLNAMPSIRMF